MKSKTLLYRTLVFSLYPTLGSNCFLPSPPGTLVLKTGELAKRFRVSVGRMKDQLLDLEAMGFITDLHVDKFVATYRVVHPEDFGNKGRTPEAVHG